MSPPAARLARATASAMPLVLVLVVILLGGCQMERAPLTDPLGRAPEDFTVDVTILTGPKARDRSEAHLREGHFLVLADGSLHHDSGASVTFSQRPGLTRSLYQEQVSDLWVLANKLGFGDPVNSDFDGNPALIHPQADEVVYLLYFTAEGQRWSFVRNFRVTEAPDPASVRFIRALAQLAWSTDLPEDRFLPTRYDFGPDPYQSFRRPKPSS